MTGDWSKTLDAKLIGIMSRMHIQKYTENLLAKSVAIFASCACTPLEMHNL